MKKVAFKAELSFIVATFGLIFLLQACDISGNQTSYRIIRQDSKDSNGVIQSYWIYSYDSNGYTTEVKNFDSSNVLLSTSTYSYTNGLRSLSTNKNSSGAVTGYTAYNYTNGVLNSSVATSSTGTINSSSTYEFSGNKKIKTNRYLNTGSYNGKIEYTYDSSGLRTGGTAFNASGGITNVYTRTYENNLLKQVALAATASTTYRVFTYETGISKVDNDIYFEF